MKKTVAIACLAALILPHHALAHGGGLDEAGCHENTDTGIVHCHEKEEDTDAGGTLLRIGALVLIGTLAQSFLVNDDEQPAALQFNMTTKAESGNGEQPAVWLGWAYRF